MNLLYSQNTQAIPNIDFGWLMQKNLSCHVIDILEFKSSIYVKLI
jgi:hypothetical protein